MRITAPLLIICIVFGFNAQANAEPLKVVASFSIISDLVRQVGGEYVDVKTLVGPDGDAHVYQPSPIDGKKIADASVLFINGLGFEGWIERLMKSAEFKGKVVTVSHNISSTLALKEEENGKSQIITDPHAWQDLGNGRLYVKNIRDALTEADPKHANSFQTNAAKIDSALAEIDKNAKKLFAEIPESKRIIITSHDAFGYFARAYGVRFMAPVGLSTEAEPSAKDIKKLITQIKESGVKTIFLETLSSDKIVKQLAEETGISVGAALYADTLSQANGPAPTYQDMFKYNLDKLVAAMQSAQH